MFNIDATYQRNGRRVHLALQIIRRRSASIKRPRRFARSQREPSARSTCLRQTYASQKPTCGRTFLMTLSNWWLICDAVPRLKTSVSAAKYGRRPTETRSHRTPPECSSSEDIRSRCFHFRLFNLDKTWISHHSTILIYKLYS